MISPIDTVASNLWHAHLEHQPFVPQPTPNKASPVALPTTILSRGHLRGNDNGASSELPYLTKDHTEPSADCPSSPSPSISSSNSGFVNSLLSSMLFYDSDSDDEESFNTSFESASSGPCVTRSSSRPVLHVQIGSGPSTDTESSSPSPVDSGYASRPDTPFLDKDTGSSSLDVPPTCLENSNAGAKKLPTGIDMPAGLKPVYHTKEPSSQGPVPPRIVLVDEQGRVVDHPWDDQLTSSSGSIALDTYDNEGAYGGLMPVEVTNNNLLSVDSRPRVFINHSGAPTTTLPTTSVYYNHCHPAFTFILDSVEEEEVGEPEEGQVGVEESKVSLDRRRRVAAAIDADGSPSTAENRVSSYLKPFYPATRVSNSHLGVASPTTELSSSIANKPLPPKPVYNEEDEELESCGLFFSEPDANYLRLTREFCQPIREPKIVFGFLKGLPSQVPVKPLRTAYHAAAEGRTLVPRIARCTFDCENGYWIKQGGLATIGLPAQCPAHGGRGSCHVDAILHHQPSQPSCSSPSPDYFAHAVEVVGVLVTPNSDSLDDFDEDELVLHRAEVIHAPQQKRLPPGAGADYDEFMSGFMDDVDLGVREPARKHKSSPSLSKLGDALKELRNAAMPEAVDHFKESLEKTESVFRAALAASPFKLGVVSDKLHFKSGHKLSVSKEKNEFYSVMKERSAVSMKGKWSNMLNKFTR